MKAITNKAIAERHVLTQVRNETRRANELMEAIGEFVPADIEAAEAAFDAMIENAKNGGEIEQLDDRTVALIELNNTNNFIERLNLTLSKIDELLLIDGSMGDLRKARRLQAAGKLASPAGFHPDQRVFVEVA